jgi:hypothetical protein
MIIFDVSVSLSCSLCSCHSLSTKLYPLLLLLLLGSKSCLSTLDIIGLRVPTRYLQDFSLFHVSSYYKNCPSGRCVLFVIIWMFLEGNLLHLVRCDTLLHYFKVLLLIM